MKNLRMILQHRDRERGTVALLVAVMWTALFGMAVVAIDFGYLYTKKRNMQSTADAALIAAMPLFAGAGGGTLGAAAARPRVIAVAASNQYVADSATTVEGALVGGSPNQFQVTVGRTHPTFFGGIFGLRPRSITAKATGQLTGGGGSGAAIHSNDSGACAAATDWARGIQFTGEGVLNITGNLQSKNMIHIGNPSMTICDGVTCRITGTVQTPCTFFNDAGTSVMGAPVPIGGSPTDPLSANTLASLEASCSPGYSTTTPIVGGLPWVAGPCVGGSSLPTGVYCSSADISVSPPSGASICPSTVSFISAGTVGITGDGAITLTAAPGTNGIIAFSNAGMGGGPAIQLSNGPVLGNYTLNGSVYAPFGLVNVGTGTPGFTMTGILDGYAVAIAMGPGQPWTFNPPGGGGGGGTWTMIQ